MIELDKSYSLVKCFRPDEKDAFFSYIDSVLSHENLRESYSKKRNEYLKDKVNVTNFLVWLFENYPISKNKYFKNLNIIYPYTGIIKIFLVKLFLKL